MITHNAVREICRIGKMMYERKLISGRQGNISVMVNRREIWTTPAGSCKGLLSPDDLVRVNVAGDVILGGVPSTEIKMHLKIYRELPDIRAVVHAHPVYAGAYACARKALDKFYSVESEVTLGIVPLAPYALPSTEEVPESISPFLKDHKAVLLANHGALAWGETLDEAYFLMDSLEAEAKIRYLTENIGGVELGR